MFICPTKTQIIQQIALDFVQRFVQRKVCWTYFVQQNGEQTQICWTDGTNGNVCSTVQQNTNCPTNVEQMHWNLCKVLFNEKYVGQTLSNKMLNKHKSVGQMDV